MIYNVVWFQMYSKSIYIRYFPFIGSYELQFPVLCSMFLLVICSIYSSMYMLIPTHNLSLPSLSPLVTVHLFSMSVGIFLFHKVHYYSKQYIDFNIIPIKFTNGIFHRTGMKNVKFVWRHKRSQIAKAILRKKNKA